MDTVGKDANIEPSDWPINTNNLTNTTIGMIPICNPMVESSGPIIDSFGPPILDQSMNGLNLGYCDVSVRNDGSTSSSLGPVKADLGWSPNAMLRGGMVIPPVLPQSLPHFPADSAFIERAARFSCFSEMMNTFSDPLNPYPRPIQGPHEVLGGNGLKQLQRMQLDRNEMSRNEVSNEAKHGTEGSPFKNEKRSENYRDEAKQGVNGSGDESKEAEFSSRGPQEELDSAGGEPSEKGLGSKKRKRGRQDTENEENNEASKPKDMVENKQKGDESKLCGKNVKQGGSEGSDPPKEEYIHIRARRGQATNSHSLAERLRREKISERMKFLQDLVPGCSKVTGKAVMLDEIINYVQSLQRQVEFLSMKLATVNPRLDFNIEGLLAKDMLQPRGLLPDMSMPFPSIHPPQPCFCGTSAETLRRSVNLLSPALSVGGLFNESTSQVSSVWEDELHNVVHMGFTSSAPLNTQDLSGSLPPGHMKAEP